MDGQRFDHLARVLASDDASRRVLARVLARGLAGGVLALLGLGGDNDGAEAAGCYKKKKRCRDHHQCCSGRCRKGWCKGGKRGEQCRRGQARCDGRCVNVQTDPENCGGCGQTCMAGRCCGGACVDLQTDLEHCGGCGVACENGAICVAGACACPEGTRSCNGRCIQPDACCGVCIVLTWGESPPDLDSHGWTPDGTEVSYRAKGDIEAFPWMELDIDDITGFGPEQISISQLSPGQTSYAVQNYSVCRGLEESSLAGSGATVRVTRDGENLGEFTVPETGEGVWWNVFEFDEDGALTIIDEISDTPLRPSAVICDTSAARGADISKAEAAPDKREARPGRHGRKGRNR